MRAFHECRVFTLFTSVPEKRPLQTDLKLVRPGATLYNCFTSYPTFPLFLLKQINAVGFKSPFTAMTRIPSA